MEQAYEKELLGVGKMWVLSDGVGEPDIENIKNDQARLAMGGAIRIIAAGATDGEEKWSNFETAWSTFEESTFNSYLPSWLQLEDGFFTNTANGPDNGMVKDVGTFEYDAVAALGLYACMYQPEGPVNKSWSNWIMSDPTRLSFNGLSGEVAFSETGNRHSLSANYRMFVAKVDATGTSFELKQSYNSALNKWELLQGQEMTFLGNSPTVPMDTFFKENVHSPSGTKPILYFMVVFLWIELSVCLVWTIVNRKSAIVRSSQTKFLVMFVIGGYISAISIIPMTFDDVDDLEGLARNGTYAHANMGCSLTLWLYTTGFAFMYAPLFAKMWRVHKLFTNKTMKRVNIPNGKLFGIVLGIAGVQAVIMMAFQIQSPMKFVRISMNTDSYGRITESYGTCVSDGQSSFLILIFSAQLIFLLGGNYLGYLSRNLNTSFSEGKYVTIALVAKLQVLAIGLPVTVMVAEDPISTMFIRSAILFLNTFTVQAFIFGPKIAALALHWKDSVGGTASKVGSTSVAPTVVADETSAFTTK